MPDSSQPYLEALNLLDSLVASPSAIEPRTPASSSKASASPTNAGRTSLSSPFGSSKVSAAAALRPRSATELSVDSRFSRQRSDTELSVDRPQRQRSNTEATHTEVTDRLSGHTVSTLNKKKAQKAEGTTSPISKLKSTPVSSRQAVEAARLSVGSGKEKGPSADELAANLAAKESFSKAKMEEAEDRVQALEAQLEQQAQEIAAAKRALERAEAQRRRQRGALDCAQVLQYSLSAGGRAMLESAEEYMAEIAEHAGSGEHEEPSDVLWAEILCQQSMRLSELLSENRSLHAQSDLRARLAQCNASSEAEKTTLHELRSRGAIQKALTAKLLDWTTTKNCISSKAQGLEWRRCDVEEALAHYSTISPHMELMELLTSTLGHAVEVTNIPAILGELLEHDVAAAAEVLLLECARMELTLSLRRSTGSLKTSSAESRGTELRRAGMVCCGLVERAEALRLEAPGDLHIPPTAIVQDISTSTYIYLNP